MRRSRVRELKRARPVAWLEGLRHAAFEPCWRTTLEGRQLAAELTAIVNSPKES